MPVVLDYSDTDHCVHGVYVGGCGIDWMCGRCENGEGPDIMPVIYPGESWTYHGLRSANHAAHVWSTWCYVMDAGDPVTFEAVHDNGELSLSAYLAAIERSK